MAVGQTLKEGYPKQRQPKTPGLLHVLSYYILLLMLEEQNHKKKKKTFFFLKQNMLLFFKETFSGDALRHLPISKARVGGPKASRVALSGRHVGLAGSGCQVGHARGIPGEAPLVRRRRNVEI